ncbi:MAG: hypothetical protein ABIL58_14250 [Pseudomonadota bacterium]
MIVQVYEIQEPVEAESVISLGVDHVGSVILSPVVWKHPVIRETIRSVQSAGARSSLIPLYREPEAVYRALDYYGPNIVHFCDLLSDAVLPELIALQESVRTRYPEIAIMRSIPIAPAGRTDGAQNLSIAAALAPVSDWFLTDTLLVDDANGAADQPVAGFVGITGATCDWDTAARLVALFNVPVILAGGLGPDNVAAAVRATRPAGVDSCTHTNATATDGAPIRFRKNMDAVARFVTAARAAADGC